MNAPRIFISYRTSDGVDKATALARDLNAAFGADQVFLDKEDLAAGVPWREAIGATMHGKPVLLLLVTPQLLGERLRDADDPVRREIAAALAAGAYVIPLLADGVEALPAAPEWPAEMRTVAERTWRRLRAYDWREDVERLVGDLRALGVPRPAQDATQRGGDDERAATTTGALGGAWRLAVAPPVSDIGSRLEAVTLHLTQVGEEVRPYSEPIDITRDPKHWQERFGQVLDRVVWRGAGRARLELGSPPAIDLGLRVETPAGSAPLETGNLSAELAADGQRMAGRVWLNGEQAKRAASMTRMAR